MINLIKDVFKKKKKEINYENLLWEDIEHELIEALYSRAEELRPTEPKGFSLIRGFFMQPVQSSLSGGIVIGGPTIPVVGLVGNKSGQIYYYALKVLLPEIDLGAIK